MSNDAPDGARRGRLDLAIQKLGKWRGLYAGWWFGTRPNSDPSTQAARDNFDRTIMLRCEVNAFTQLLIKKGVFTIAEFETQLLVEVQHMDAQLETQWPGFHTSAAGLEMQPFPLAAETMKKRGFKP